MLPRTFLILAFALAAAPSRAEDWPGFRGPTGQGISSETGLPARWSESENVAWKTPIPGDGWSSPIVLGNRVYVTTATDGGAACRVLALERETGKVLWDREVCRQPTKRKEAKNSHATPTPAADGTRVYAVFGDGSVAALERDGTVAWTNREVKFYSQHGLGASPLLHEDLIIMPFDGSTEAEDKEERVLGWQKPWDRSELVAYEKDSGKIRWRGKRGLSRIAHTTPVIHRSGDRVEILSNAGDVIQGFDPRNGDLLWTVRSQGEGVVPTAVTGAGLIFTASGFEEPTIRAVKAGARGEATATHIAWEEKRGVPMIPSMVLQGPHLFAITTKGAATCFEAASGKVLGQERIDGNHSSSPVWAEGKVYFLSEEGECAIVEATPEMRVVARNRIDGRCQASMAVSGGRIFIRSDRHLYAIGKRAP